MQLVLFDKEIKKMRAKSKTKFTFILSTLLGMNFYLNAQIVITQDSIPLYQIRQDDLDQKKLLPTDKGYVASIRANDAGLDLNIFKQSPGYFMVDKATAPKGLESGINYLPDLAQYSFIDGHFKPGKEKVFSLNKGMEKPFEYKFLQVSSTTGRVMTEGNLNLGDSETGGNYSKLLQMMPEALNYKGAEISDNYFYFTKTSEVSFAKYPMAFNPYMGMYIDKNGGVKELFTLGGAPNSIDKANAQFKISFPNIAYNFLTYEHRVFMGKEMAKFLRNNQ